MKLFEIEDCDECPIKDEGICPGGWTSGAGGTPIEPPCTSWDGDEEVDDYIEGYGHLTLDQIPEEETKYMLMLEEAKERGAMFDARCFNTPKEEVCNLIYWRQLDAIRNSIQMVGQANFSQKELQNLSCDKIKQKLKDEKNISWDDMDTCYKHGVACKKIDSRWKLDYNMPILKGENRKYVNECILYED